MASTKDSGTASSAVKLFLRQTYPDGNLDEYYFWTTTTGVIVKWCLFLALWLIIALYLILGRRSAKRRVRRGLRPRRGTAWFLSRSERAMYDPRFANPGPGNVWPTQVYYHHQNPEQQGGHNGYYQPGSYGMNDMHGGAPPPPVYDPNRPPQYQENGMMPPPPGASKADPGQGAPPYAPAGGDPAGTSAGEQQHNTGRI